MSLGKKDLNNRFGDHSAKIEGPADPVAHHALRQGFLSFAEFLDEMIPDSRQKSLAMTELETASMWAHKAMINKES